MSTVRVTPPRIATTDTRRIKPADRIPDPQLTTPEHRQWAEAVRKRAGYRCQAPWHDPSRPREGIRLFADHIIERRDGGALHDLNNGMALCGSCHTTKTLKARGRRMARTDPLPPDSNQPPPYDPLGFA